MSKSMRQHLVDVHADHAEHHAGAAKLHKLLSEHHQAVADCHAEHDEELSKAHEKISSTHAELSEHHATHAEKHIQHAKALAAAAKAEGAEDLNKIVPDGVHGILPQDNPNIKLRSGARAVPRPGSPDLVNAAGVAPEMVETFLTIE